MLRIGEARYLSVSTRFLSTCSLIGQADFSASLDYRANVQVYCSCGGRIRTFATAVRALSKAECVSVFRRSVVSSVFTFGPEGLVVP
jgi:hypothetical protein